MWRYLVLGNSIRHPHLALRPVGALLASLSGSLVGGNAARKDAKMGVFGGAKAQNFLTALAPAGAREEVFTDGGRAKKSDIFSRLLAACGAAAGEKKNLDAQKSTSGS